MTTEETEVWLPKSRVPLVRSGARVRAIGETGIDLFGLPGIEPDAGLVRYLQSFQEIVSWYGASRPEFRNAMQALGVPVRFLAALPPEDGTLHAADFFLRQVGGQGPALPRVPVPACVRRGIVIHPLSGGARKNWPLARFQELARRLARYGEVRWSRGPEEQLPGAVCLDEVYELACWLAGAELYIGNDSGVSHLAAAVGTPVVALFGPTRPEVWVPRGPVVRVVRAESGDMMTLAADAVEEACLAVLEEVRGGSRAGAVREPDGQGTAAGGHAAGERRAGLLGLTGQ